MRVSALLPLAFGFAVAYPNQRFVTRATASGLDALDKAITTIETQITTLNTTLNGFQDNQLSTLTTLLSIENESTTLANDIKAATAIANNTCQLDEGSSITLGEKVLELEPKIFSLLTNIINHKSTFDGAADGIINVSALIKQTLIQQKELSRELGVSIIAILATDLDSVATPVTAAINAAFDKAIAAYASNSGVISLSGSSDSSSSSGLGLGLGGSSSGLNLGGSSSLSLSGSAKAGSSSSW